MDACRCCSRRSSHHRAENVLANTMCHACVQMLQHEGQPPDSSNFEGRTALMLAAMHGHRDVALALLGAGADPNVRDKEGSTALLKAVRNAHDSIVSLLRSCGAECAPHSLSYATFERPSAFPDAD